MVVALTSRQASNSAARNAQIAAAAAAAAHEIAVANKETLGEKNGNGDVTTMLARSLGELSEMRAELIEVRSWQKQHSSDDIEDFTAIKRRIEHVEELVDVIDQLLDARTPLFAAMSDRQAQLEDHVRRHLHDLRNMITPIKGRLDMMWTEFVARTEPVLDDMPDHPATSS